MSHVVYIFPPLGGKKRPHTVDAKEFENWIIENSWKSEPWPTPRSTGWLTGFASPPPSALPQYKTRNISSSKTFWFHFLGWLVGVANGSFWNRFGLILFLSHIDFFGLVFCWQLLLLISPSAAANHVPLLFHVVWKFGVGVILPNYATAYVYIYIYISGVFLTWAEISCIVWARAPRICLYAHRFYDLPSQFQQT